MTETAALVVAAGLGTRMSGNVPKQYRQLAGQAVLRRTLNAFVSHPAISRVCPVIHRDDLKRFTAASLGLNLDAPIYGGETRQDSVRLGLEHLAQSNAPDKVLIHDGARPLVRLPLGRRVLRVPMRVPAQFVHLGAGDAGEARSDLWGRVMH